MQAVGFDDIAESSAKTILIANEIFYQQAIPQDLIHGQLDQNKIERVAY